MPVGATVVRPSWEPARNHLVFQRSGLSRLTVDCGCTRSGAMVDIWRAAEAGDLDEVQRLVGQDPGLLNARDGKNMTPLMRASWGGHVEVARWLVAQGADIDERGFDGMTALLFACYGRRTDVARLLVEKAADPTIADRHDALPLMAASWGGDLEVVRSLLRLPSAKAAINRRGTDGEAALHLASFRGHVGVVRALLESGADPTIADNGGRTPMAAAKQEPNPDEKDPDDEESDEAFAERRRECVVALEVRTLCVLSRSFPAPLRRSAG
jgi:hypothetical protein